MKFGEKLKSLREQKNMTQPELAKAIGVALRSLQYYENGEGYPRREVYPKFADFFGVDVNYLLTETEEFLDEAAVKYGRRGQVQAQNILEQASALFAGGDLSEEDQIAFLSEMQQLYLDSKGRAREKFTAKRHRKD